MEWFTLEWLMINLEWAVGLLVIGCIILFFFPILLGWQLKKDAQKEDKVWTVDAIPLISILVLIFAMVLMSEVIKLKKETRKLSKLVGHLKKDINILKSESDE